MYPYGSDLTLLVNQSQTTQTQRDETNLFSIFAAAKIKKDQHGRRVDSNKTSTTSFLCLSADVNDA